MSKRKVIKPDETFELGLACRQSGIFNPKAIPKMVKLLELIPHTERCNEGISDGCDYRCCYDEAQSILNELGITKGDSK